MRTSILLGCLALALVGWVRPAASGTLDANSIHETVFPSGLRLVVREAHGADLAAVQVWIKAGGFLEDQTTSGHAHVIEHLVFKGTQRRGPGAIDEEIESLGGELTATTEKDWTMYGTTVASQHALHVIDVLGDALRHPRFQTSDFQAEKPLILEEVAEGRAEPEHVVTDVLFRQAFQHHPYARDARGSPTVINHLNLDSLKAYFGKYYTAPNTTVVVVGDVQSAAVERQVRTAFGAETPAASKPSLKLPDPEIACQSPRRQVLETPFDTAFIGLAFPAPAVTTGPDVYATDILVTLLEHVPYGRLPAALRGKVAGLKATFETRRQPGLLTIIAQTNPTDLDEVEKTLRTELQRLIDQPPTAQEIDFTRRQLVGSFVGDNETFSGQAGSLGFYAAIDRWQFATTYLDNVRKVTPEQVQATIKKYISLDHCCTVVLQPRQPGSRPAPPAITTLRQGKGHRS